MRKRSRTARLSLAVGLVALLASVAAVAAPPAQAVTNCSPSSSWGSNRADLASQVVGLINQYRAGKGLSQLAVSAPLTASSEWKSLHMAGYGYFAHDDSGAAASRSAYQRARDCGYSGSSWGENIAWGYATAQSVVNGWLGSAGHKANIENPGFSSTGVGVAANGSGQLVLDPELRQRRRGQHAAGTHTARTDTARTDTAGTDTARTHTACTRTPPTPTPPAPTPPAGAPAAPVAAGSTAPVNATTPHSLGVRTLDRSQARPRRRGRASAHG